MLYDHSDLIDVAQRIAAAESRIATLQGRVTRLAKEGSDAVREQEVLSTLSSNLRQLYARQSRIRSMTWRFAS